MAALLSIVAKLKLYGRGTGGTDTPPATLTPRPGLGTPEVERHSFP